MLGTFLFSDDDVDKKIAVLSGGEKARVALARLMVDPGNLLLMDEPTNHLDLESSEALADALGTYDGTLIFVSHNRSFVRHLATRIWYVHDNCVEEFPGTMDEFLYHLAAKRAGDDAVARAEKRQAKTKDAARAEAAPAANDASAASPSNGNAAPPPRSKEDKARERASDRESQKKRRELEKRVQEYEKRISELESLQAGRSNELSQPDVYADKDRYGPLLSSYTEDQKKLEELMLRWEQSQAELAATGGTEAGQ